MGRRTNVSSLCQLQGADFPEVDATKNRTFQPLVTIAGSNEFTGSCQELFTFSEGKGISRYDKVVLNIGTGHGILYKPLDEWITPLIQWAGIQ